MTQSAIRSDLISRFEAQRVPRYTSYPAANHFTQHFGDAGYRKLLADLPREANLSLYLHIPFCQSLCWYCGCHTKIVAEYSPIQRYLRALKNEIRAVASALPGKRMTVSQIHWGGGTPTIMAPGAFQEMMELLHDRFDISERAEIAVEIDPRRLGDDMVNALGSSGITRASLGVQTFDPVVQKAINRVQTFEQTAWAVERLRTAGIRSINCDLIYGLPFQTAASCEDTVMKTLEIGPERFSVFGYAHVPWMKKHQRLIRSDTLPDAHNRLAQFSRIAELLINANYRKVGLDHFAKPDDLLARSCSSGTLHRNFQGYTTDQCHVLLGLGASAISTLPDAYLQNTSKIGEYQRQIEDGFFAIERGRRLTAEDRMRRDVIERIMCDFSVDLGAIAHRHGRTIADFQVELGRLAELESDGILHLDGDRMSISESCWPLARSIAAIFDTYLQPEEQRHAAAI